jgi:hypothetical protein
VNSTVLMGGESKILRNRKGQKDLIHVVALLGWKSAPLEVVIRIRALLFFYEVAKLAQPVLDDVQLLLSRRLLLRLFLSELDPFALATIEGHLVVDKGELYKLCILRYETSLGLNGCRCAELMVSVSYWRIRMHSARARACHVEGIGGHRMASARCARWGSTATPDKIHDMMSAHD